MPILTPILTKEIKKKRKSEGGRKRERKKYRDLQTYREKKDRHKDRAGEIDRER